MNVNWLEARTHPATLFSCQKCNADTQVPVAFVNDAVGTTLIPSLANLFKMFRISFAKDNTEKFTDYTTASLVAMSVSN